MITESSESAEHLLRKVFGFHDFLPFQKQIIDAALEGADLLAILPTGSGKSLCFQIPALLNKGITVVISPLIALMKDQIDRLSRFSLPVDYLNSSLSAAEARRTLDSILSGATRIIYVSPERLRDSVFLNTLRSAGKTPPLWVVDEAHCITEWGHDFRTDYLFIPDAIELVSRESQLIMFTATATPVVREDILRQMRRPSSLVICGGFDRPNLYLGCRIARTRSDKLQTLGHLLRKPGPGIIYAATRRQCETVNQFLQEFRFRADFYHAGRSSAVRKETHEKFMGNELDIVVATNAFGMGLNKPDIRFIIHYAHPGSIDAYYQEIGRGGRDGFRCDCILLYSPYDRRVQERFIVDSTPAAQSVADFFDDITHGGAGSSRLCISRSVYEEKNIELFELEKVGALKRESSPGGIASVYLSRQFEKGLAMATPEERRILLALEDHFDISKTGVASSLDVYEFCSKATPELSPFMLEQRLLNMSRNGMILYRIENQDIRYRMLASALSEQKVGQIGQNVTARRSFKMKRLDTMTGYAAHSGCLRQYLLSALGDPVQAGSCGFCDNC